MDDHRHIRISKFLSKHLRHAPEALGLTLTPGGWVSVENLLTAAAHHGFRFSREQLDEVVAQNDKQRFAFDPTGTQIRANQGHSVAVDLQLAPLMPPPLLYHGTAQRFITAIGRDGLQKMSRQHVHLSADPATARKVGARHGAPVVFVVDAAAMHTAGHAFFRAANGVWLVDQVPPEYLRTPDEE